MPRLTPTGRTLAGIDQVVSLDGRVLMDGRRAGGWAPFNDTEVAGPMEVGDGRWAIVTDSGRVLDPTGGANTFCAGGGQWAAFTWPGGVRGSNPALPLPNAQLLAVTRSGELVVKPDYHSASGFRVYDRQGLVIVESPEAVFAAAEDDVFLPSWAVPAGLIVYRVCRAVTSDGAAHAIAWLQDPGRTVLWQVGSDRCKVLGAGEEFNPDILALADGRFRVCWSKRAGERPSDDALAGAGDEAARQRVADHVGRPSEITTKDIGDETPWVTFDSLKAVPSQWPAKITPFDVPLFFGAYYVTGAAGRPDIAAAGNVEVIADDTPADRQVVRRPYFAGLRAYEATSVERRKDCRGIIVGSVDELWLARETVPHLPRLVYDDRTVDTGVFDESLLSAMRPEDIALVQCYPRIADEATWDFEQRCLAYVRRCEWRGHRVVICAGWFSRNGRVTRERVKALMPSYEWLLRGARDSHDVTADIAPIGMLAFAYNRATGIVDLGLVPEFEAFAAAAGSALPSIALPAAPAPQPPPTPAPAPTPAPVPVSRFPMKCGLKVDGQILRKDPSEASNDRALHADRASVGPHEEVEVTKDGDDYVAAFVASECVLSIGPDGRLESRPKSKVGAWERLKAALTPDGKVAFLYRLEGENLVSKVVQVVRA